ncbi:chorion peroxidase-like [Argonauta hians]
MTNEVINLTLYQVKAVTGTERVPHLKLLEYLTSFHKDTVMRACQYANEACPASTTYQANGKCNNVKTTAAGSQNSPLGRTISYLATGRTGNIPFTNLIQNPLPEPRVVSTTVFPCHDNSEMDASHLFANFGKLLMADMFNVKRQSAVSACSPSTLGIKVDASDPRNCASSCINYYKPEQTTNLACTGSNINAINQKTHVIDASFLFDDISLEANGKIKTTNDLLPMSNGAFTGIPSSLKENPLTVALFHVFVREYNKLVDKMTPFNQATGAAEAKKLLIAIFQHITYNEFLPKLLGAGTTAKALPTGNPDYSDKDLPIISHTLVVALKILMASISRDNVEIAPNTNINMIEIFNDPTYINDDTKLTNIIKGMLKEKSLNTGRSDCKFTDDVATSIQDSRVYGIPPYLVFLALKNKHYIDSFEKFPYHDPAQISILQSTYKVFYGVDALSGLFSEKKEANSNVGTLLKHVLELEFNGLRKGDRFFYEHPNVFQPHQLAEIRKVSLSHLLCRNVKNLAQVNQKAFDTTGNVLQCSSLKYIDFCKYHNIIPTWNAWSTTTPEPCKLFRVQTRTCSSTITECACQGVPFKIEPCPGGLLTFEFRQVLSKLNENLKDDSLALSYYHQQKWDKLQARAEQLYAELNS